MEWMEWTIGFFCLGDFHIRIQFILSPPPPSRDRRLEMQSNAMLN
jgi:hypothetical protein